jgi:serine/threonine protein kinase
MTLTKEQPRLPIGTLIEDLQIVRVLSIGAFGQVYMARHTRTLKRYAVKSFPRHGLDSQQLAFQRNEITLHSHLSDHPHIIRLEKVVRTPEWTHAILEYGSEGDLFSSITDKGIYFGNHALIRHVFLQLIDSVRYCHDHHIFHRDLKPENILTFDNGKTIKLADFGLATTDLISTDYGCGSTFYFSPECQGGLDRQRRLGYATAPNDVWALGIILINLATGRNPWKIASLDDESFCGFLHDPNLLMKILPISSELNKILKRIFCLDPRKRITLDELYVRIQRCTYFTRTPEVTEKESMMAKAAAAATPRKRYYPKKSIDTTTTTILDHDTLPSPPPEEPEDMISSSSSSNSSLTEIDLVSQAYYVPKKGGNLDSHYIHIVV